MLGFNLLRPLLTATFKWGTDEDRLLRDQLVRAMVGAAKADGHIDATEQRRLFAEVERLGLDAEAKAYIFDLLQHDVDMKSLVDAVGTPEQGAELYLASRLAIDPDEPAERAYLDALAARLRLPPELRASLDHAAGGEVSRDLDRLYEFALDQLSQANLTRTAAGVDNALQVMSTLEEGWDGIIPG